MAETWYPGAIKLLITTGEFNVPRGVPLEGIVDHISDGTDSRNHGQNVANNSSFHFLIRIENGKAVIYQFMPVEWAAWGNGRFSNNNPNMPAWVKALITRNVSINHATVSIEHERKWPFTTTLPPLMLEASIKLHKWLAATFPTIKVDRDHIIGHYQIDHIDRAHCPGGVGGKLFPFDTIIQAMQGTPTPPLAPKPAIQAYWEANGGVPVFGNPITGEKQEWIGGQQYTVQYFERARLEYQPGREVTRGLIGVELLRCRGEL